MLSALSQTQPTTPTVMAVIAVVLAIAAFGAGKLCLKQSVAPAVSEDGAGKVATSVNPIANAVVASEAPQGSKLLVALETPYFGQPEGDQKVLGVLGAGTTIEVLQSMTDGNGRTKIQHAAGWSPAAAPDGRGLLGLPAAPAALAAAPEQPAEAPKAVEHHVAVEFLTDDPVEQAEGGVGHAL